VDNERSRTSGIIVLVAQRKVLRARNPGAQDDSCGIVQVTQLPATEFNANALWNPRKM
jgi:hypothetical protein